MSPTIRALVLACSLSVGPVTAACDDDRDATRDHCDRVTRRCYWNEATQTYDRDCVLLTSPDGSPVSCPVSDAGVDANQD